ncbi:MAG: desulfoferrodoxin [Prevotella sp.]|nr:desulfoferrodoxin [Prevotella sp.]
MTQKREIYRCSICGNMIEVTNAGVGTLVCCEKPMVRLDGNEADASFEKHVPVVEKMSGGYRVRVGSLSHPMTEGHYIQWIELMTKKKVLRHELTPDDMPEATFLTDEEMVCARAYCNLHGLWIKK